MASCTNQKDPTHRRGEGMDWRKESIVSLNELFCFSKSFLDIPSATSHR